MEQNECNPAIFRAYDIRGIYPHDVHVEHIPRIAEEFAMLLSRKYQTAVEKLTIVVGRDIRHGGDTLARAFIESAQSTGISVIDAGLISTDMMYFAVGHFGYDGGVIVTASHNPKEYNGLKFVGRGVDGIDGETGIFEMRDRIMHQKAVPAHSQKGSYQEKDILPDFVSHVLSFVKSEELKPLTIAVDAGNGMGSMVWEAVSSKLHVNTIPLNFTLDGNFPGRGPDPGQKDSLAELKAAVHEHNADIGFAFDGDADRMYTVDNQGECVNGSVLIALMAEEFLKMNENASVTILYNVTGGRIIRDTLRKYPHAQGIVTPVGHAKIKRLAKQYKADFAGEAQSGHFFFKNNFYADSAIIFALKLLEIISRCGAPLSQLAKPYEKYVWSGELNFPLSQNSEKDMRLKKLKEHYKGTGECLEIDGVRIDFDDWWVSVRPSNTEPLLRVNVEARTNDALLMRIDEVMEVLGLKGK